MLKVWFPGTNDTEDYGLGGTQWINDNVVIADDGKLGKCLSFNGSNSRLSTTNFELSNNWSFACWVKDDSSVTNWRLLIMLNTTGSDADTQMSFWLHTGEKRFEVCANGRYVSTVKYVPGQWNHFAATYDGLQILVYLNGVKVYTLSDSNEQLVRHNLTIGARGTNANGGHEEATSYFYGLVNDLRIWDNQVISPREIKELSKGLVLHYPLAMPGQENLVTGSNTNSTATNKWFGNSAVGGNTSTIEVDETGTNCVKVTRDSTVQSSWDFLSYNALLSNQLKTNTTYTVSFDAKPSVDGTINLVGFRNSNATNNMTASVTQVQSSLLANKWNHCVYHCTTLDSFDEITISGQVVYLSRSTSLKGVNTTVLFKNIKVEEGEIATPWIPNSTDTAYSTLGFNDGIEYDVSGYQHNGTKVGVITYDSDTPRYNTSAVFNGTTSFIQSDSLPSETISVSFWMKKIGSASAYIVFADYNTKLCFGLENNDHFNTGITSSPRCTTFSKSAITINEWQHVVLIKTGANTRRLYVNGVEQSPVSENFWTHTPKTLLIGCREMNSTKGYYFNGQLADFRAYTTELSADDALELYQTGASLSNNGTLLGYEYVET